ncbi:hypothetical protein [Leeia aquatica]|uniref:Uncharacterized protein n=1 Tax=Leeia aquatica TaxID=2725557 RepID=A0A847S320_9NEIS|nr:hypothetical protein [Leeia aquatica]NLR76191.1 hypothetical protein [Leeia aquatica]
MTQQQHALQTLSLEEVALVSGGGDEEWTEIDTRELGANYVMLTWAEVPRNQAGMASGGSGTVWIMQPTPGAIFPHNTPDSTTSPTPTANPNEVDAFGNPLP